MRKILLILCALILIVASLWLLKLSQKESGTNVPQEPNKEFTVTYPNDFGLTYVHPVDWPPVLTTLADTNVSCVDVGKEISGIGKTEVIEIEGTTYCKTILIEGAAGSTYTTYTYVFRREANVLRLTFSVRMPQCMNYDDPEQSICVQDEARFNADSVVAGIVKTIQ